MKNSIQLNIGLARNDGHEPNNIPETAQTMRRYGLILTSARIVIGEWEGQREETLACECLPALPVCHYECRLAIAVQVAHLARELGQTCIALRWPLGDGELCPPQKGMEFDPEFFHQVLTGKDGVALVINALEDAADIERNEGNTDNAENLTSCAGLLHECRSLIDLGPSFL